MGMFDYIETEKQQLCRSCGDELQGLQTKSGACFLETIRFSDPETHTGLPKTFNFYGSCMKCRSWHEFCGYTEKGRWKGYCLVYSDSDSGKLFTILDLPMETVWALDADFEDTKLIKQVTGRRVDELFLVPRSSESVNQDTPYFQYQVVEYAERSDFYPQDRVFRTKEEAVEAGKSVLRDAIAKAQANISIWCVFLETGKFREG